MGIQGLLPQLRSIMQPIHVQDLRGKTVAVDTYSWLHKGAICCSIQLCKGIPTSKHIEYCMHRVKLLQHHGVKPILVFDGGLLPMKIDQETKRARKRKENLKRALEHEAAGNSGAAFDCYQKAVDISPSIAFELIQVLKQENVDYVVAPYEADAQMAFLSMYHHVDAVITEDSDLIPFGCSRIIFKMDKFGNGIEFRSSMLEQNRDLDFTAFTKQMILEMCIFSGCDYLPSLPGLGLKRAHALTRKYKTFEKVIKHLKYSGVSIPPLYEENFKKAIWTFLHQRVYDPAKEDIVHLSNISPDIGEDLDFLGPWLSVNVVKRIAKGELDPLTKLPFEVSATSTMFNDGKAFSVEKFENIGRRRSLDLPVQKNVLTNYFCLASIQAKRKFRPPKYTPKDLIESSSPSSNSSESHSPGSDEVALSYGKSQSQDSVLKFVHSNEKCPATASLEDGLPNRFNKLPESPLGKSVVNGYSGPLLEEIGLDLKFTSAEIKDSVKRKVSTSPFFDNNNSLHVVVATGGQNEFSPDGHQASFYVPNQTSFLGTLVKKRKTVHLYDKMETIQLENVKSTSTPSGQDNIPNSCKDQSSRKSFGRDISHVNDYCGIAEKSMERFVSLINTFKYTSSGSRASGLRAPLKDVRNTFPMRPNKTPVDFDEFSYKSSKKAAPMAPSP